MPEFFQNRRNLIIIAIVLVLVVVSIFIFFPKQKASVSVNNQAITLTWWKPFYGQDTYNDIINDFKKIPGNQNITINVITKEYGDDYYKSLIADIAKNAGPDIFTISNDDLPAYKEYMTPIRLFTGQTLSQYRTDFVDLAVRETMDRDKVYAITSYIDNMQLYYNKTILAQSGISLPPTTWSELDRQLPKLNKRNVNSATFDQSAISLGTGGRASEGPANVNRHQDILPLLIFQNGGQLYDYQQSMSVFGQNPDAQSVNSGLATNQSFDVGTVDQNNPAYKAVRFYADFADVTKSRYSWNTASNNNVDAFVDGKLAYLIHYSYMQDTIVQRNPRLQFGVSALPQLDSGNKKTYGFFFMDGINRNLERDSSKSAQRDAAEKFLYFLSQKPSQAKFDTVTKLPGARRDVISDQLQGDEILRLFAAGSLYADNYYKPDVAASEKIWTDMMQRNEYEGQPLSDSLAEAIRQYDILVANGPKLR